VSASDATLPVRLAHASQAGDRPRLARLAHSLRSASAQVGAARLADLVGRLERDANASAPGVARLVEFCAREVEEVRLVLAKLTEHEA